MNKFKNLPIKTKLIIILVCLSGFILLIAMSLVVFYDLSHFKNSLARNLMVLAEAVGGNSRAAILFGDKDAANKILGSLKGEEQIDFAALYDDKNNIFVTYKRVQRLSFKPPTIKNEGYRLVGEKIELVKPIFLNGERVGEIYINANLNKFDQHLKTYIAIVGAIIFLAIIISIFISLKLQGIISKPILVLAAATRRITGKKDYSFRVSHQFQDELGTLYNGFNEMLIQIEKRDKELEKYKCHLEEMVAFRTQEICETNEKLKIEIQERQKVETVILESLKEKEILLKEIHHRVKNNIQIVLSMIRLQGSKVQDEKYIRMFQECANRVQSMALMHEKIYDSPKLGAVDFSDYLQDLVSELVQVYDVDSNLVEIQIETNGISLDIDQGIPCGLVILELISNSITHAFPGEMKGFVKITLSFLDETSNLLELKIKDNGIGLPIGFDFRNNKSLGLQIVKTLCEKQLKGKIDLNRSPGIEFIIHFKKN